MQLFYYYPMGNVMVLIVNSNEICHSGILHEFMPHLSIFFPIKTSCLIATLALRVQYWLCACTSLFVIHCFQALGCLLYCSQYKMHEGTLCSRLCSVLVPSNYECCILSLSQSMDKMLWIS